MEIPVIYKDIEVNGRTFRLNKMDARTGSFMIFKLTKILVPLFKDVKQEKLDDLKLDDLNLTELANSLCDLPEKEFRYIQDNCLQVVKELLPAGAQKVLDKYGKWGVLNIEFDTGLVMNLTVRSLAFNVQGFFSGSPLSSILKGLNISLPN
jgi:hypothetical protein